VNELRSLDYLAPLAGNITIDQLAFCARSDDDEKFIKQFLKLDKGDWIEDTVTAKGFVRGFGEDVTNIAKLQFNYALEHEVEILRYLSGPNYLDKAAVPGGRMCHIGSHFVGKADVPRVDAPIIQQLVTQTHSNPFQAEHNRHYRYTIYDTYNRLGLFFKIIERLDRG
jgi:hypothetical protein